MHCAAIALVRRTPCMVNISFFALEHLVRQHMRRARGTRRERTDAWRLEEDIRGLLALLGRQRDSLATGRRRSGRSVERFECTCAKDDLPVLAQRERLIRSTESTSSGLSAATTTAACFAAGKPLGTRPHSETKRRASEGSAATSGKTQSHSSAAESSASTGSVAGMVTSVGRRVVNEESW